MTCTVHVHCSGLDFTFKQILHEIMPELFQVDYYPKLPSLLLYMYTSTRNRATVQFIPGKYCLKVLHSFITPSAV